MVAAGSLLYFSIAFAFDFYAILVVFVVLFGYWLGIGVGLVKLEYVNIVFTSIMVLKVAARALFQ